MPCMDWRAHRNLHADVRRRGDGQRDQNDDVRPKRMSHGHERDLRHRDVAGARRGSTYGTLLHHLPGRAVARLEGRLRGPLEDRSRCRLAGSLVPEARLGAADSGHARALRDRGSRSCTDADTTAVRDVRAEYRAISDYEIAVTQMRFQTLSIFLAAVGLIVGSRTTREQWAHCSWPSRPDSGSSTAETANSLRAYGASALL